MDEREGAIPAEEGIGHLIRCNAGSKCYIMDTTIMSFGVIDICYFYTQRSISREMVASATILCDFKFVVSCYLWQITIPRNVGT